MENDEKPPISEMSTEELIFVHRIAAVEWARAHADAFAKDASGDYLPEDPAKSERLSDAIDYAILIEDELEKRLNRA